MHTATASPPVSALPPERRIALEALAIADGAVVVVAPHPDDETIGCGGLIALLCDRGLPVSVILVSDGSMSHPGSIRYPRAARSALRLDEMRSALAVLGVDADALLPLGLPDGELPAPGQPGFDSAVERMAMALRRRGARTLLAPWHHDPHPDHRAASQMAYCANQWSMCARLLEYLVWAPLRSDGAVPPRDEGLRRWCLDVSGVVDRKLRALAHHRSQLGGVIDDDPGGFSLPAELLQQCAVPTETYLETPVGQYCARTLP